MPSEGKSNRLRQKPHRSLSTMLMLWLLFFAMVPLAFITGYSLIKYERAIEHELSQRLIANHREIESIFTRHNRYLTENVNKISTNELFKSYWIENELDLSVFFIQRWMESSSLIHRTSLFNPQGKFLSMVYRNDSGVIEKIDNHELKPIYMSEEFMRSMGQRETMSTVDVRPGSSVNLSTVAKVLTSKGVLLGHIECIIRIDQTTLSQLKKELDLEIIFLKRNMDDSFSSHPSLSGYNNSFFIEKISNDNSSYFDLHLLEEPFSFMVWPMSWGNDQVVTAIGASKKSVQAVLENVKYAFFTVIGVVIFFLIGLSFVISRILLKPLLDLVGAIQKVDPDKELIQLPISSKSELGLLTESFNTMSKRVHQSQNQLKKSIKNLKAANAEIKEAQSRLVHTAKMASLGQLVAGVAHELNNPIGFIYSNIGHLKKYAEKLIEIIKVAETTPDHLQEIQRKNEFDYIVKDMPKLIKSFEEGTRRSRDIVLGLRKFSRLEEAQCKRINIHEDLKETLNLLTGELKNRIEVKEMFGNIPSIMCYPSQLNQVFMNILSNAAQAIEGSGTIEIETRRVKDHVEILIRDSGQGMPPEILGKIFDPFFSTKKLGVGTGLGLSISYGIIEKHGGSIKVDSQKGEGTQFTIRLPIEGPTKSDESPGPQETKET